MGPIEGKLFASQLMSQLPRFFSWRLNSLAEAMDAFLQDWINLRSYDNPFWNLIGRVVAKVKQQEASLILIAPVWTSQLRYPMLLNQLQDFPWRFQLQEDLLWVERMGSLQEILLKLAMWPISGNTTAPREFLKKL